jgi:hypothetical protein
MGHVAVLGWRTRTRPGGEMLFSDVSFDGHRRLVGAGRLRARESMGRGLSPDRSPLVRRAGRLDEPDNFLDISAKLGLESRIRMSKKTVLLISHDRDVLSGAVGSIVTLEGTEARVHGGSYSSYPSAREERQLRLARHRHPWSTGRLPCGCEARTTRRGRVRARSCPSRLARPARAARRNESRRRTVRPGPAMPSEPRSSTRPRQSTGSAHRRPTRHRLARCCAGCCPWSGA